MGRKRVCNELIGDLLVDKDGDNLNNFLAVITDIQHELQDTYHEFRIYADTETMGVFKIYGTSI